MTLPKEVKTVISFLKQRGHEAYAVGGCVRDLLMKKEPQDWDVTTSAKPEEIQKIFPESFYENKFLTVTVQTTELQRSGKKKADLLRPANRKANLKEIEITTFRSEAKYSDKRHPDEVKFAKTLDEDLARRDFTVNAMALEIQNAKIKNQNYNAKFKIIDPFKGQEDLKNKIIRAVGNPEERFSEDALRMMRAVRFATTLNSGVDETNVSSPPFARLQRAWVIEEKTRKAIEKNAPWLRAIAKERIREELMKIIMSEGAAEGVETLRKTGLLKYIIPELEEGFGISQNKHHIYECYEHALKSLDYAAKKNFNKYVRLAALFHDIAKPRVKRGEGPTSTFYGHETVGARMTARILDRLRFSKKDVEKIVKLVRYHLFYYNVDEVGESSVRRLVRQVGPENMTDLLQVRMADRIGSGVPKAEPYKLRHLKYIIEKVNQDPISVKMLKVSGNDVMKILKIGSGPKIGKILDVLLGYVLSDPEKNKKDFLEKKVEELGKLPEKKLQELDRAAGEEKNKIETKKDEMTKKKYWVT